MVAHGDGVETRYAHLSSAAVNEGARVAAGDVIARSGNSGRATGAHLHFEVRHHGRPLNPVEVAGLVPVATTD
jgi:murein DD-endopeptidase MepM/ murein hydrolase activator NlpD